ncbi:tetratricopeptide (TPR) repeat protein [Bradyrhizobium sp. i1.15.2]|uniref:tetratricopeptide repeat protein n=1 Tax=Bradyrhizobium sp. i1.15.2 TaxID=3156362 RepID=UPI00339B09FE
MAILLDPSGNLYRNRAFAFVKKGDFDGAIASLDEAISVNRRDGSSYAARGTIYQQRAATPKRHWTDLARAKAAYKMALRLTIETDGELELRKLALDNYTKISAEEGLSDYIASWLVDEPMYLLLAAISCILIASTIYGLFAFYSNPSRPTLVDQATVPLGRTPDLAAASTDGLLSDNLELSSVDYSTVMAPHDWIHHSPKHEDPKSEPKERKPTEKVSQRSPFDRGYRN